MSPTLNQIAARVQPSHLALLRRLATNEPLHGSALYRRRDAQTMRVLDGWGAIDNLRRLTYRGKAILAAAARVGDDLHKFNGKLLTEEHARIINGGDVAAAVGPDPINWPAGSAQRHAEQAPAKLTFTVTMVAGDGVSADEVRAYAATLACCIAPPALRGRCITVSVGEVR